MRALNRRHLNHNYSTDILTFDFNQPVVTKYLNAEIIIAPAMAHQNALEHQTSTDYEIALYLIHGVLHLLGFNDHNARDIKKIRREEKRLLAVLKLG